MLLDKARPYAVVEDAGGEHERVIKRCETYDQALDYMDKHYGLAEIDHLFVDVMGVYENGSLTTEI